MGPGAFEKEKNKAPLSQGPSVSFISATDKGKISYKMQECISNFYRSGSGLFYGFSSTQSNYDKDTLLTYYARKHPEQTDQYLSEYLARLALPILPTNINDYIVEHKAFSADDIKAGLKYSNQHSAQWNATPQNKKHHDYHEDSTPWFKMTWNTNISGSLLYLMTSLLRIPYESPYAVEAGLKALDLGLNISQAWIYSLWDTATYYHHFLDLHFFGNVNDIKKIVDYDLPKVLAGILENQKPISIAEKSVTFTVATSTPLIGRVDYGTYTFGKNDLIARGIKVSQEQYLNACLEKNDSSRS